MNCEKFQDRLYEYVEGTLSVGKRATAEEHLASCVACRRAGQAEQKLTQALSNQLQQSSEALTLQPDVRRNILEASNDKAASPTTAESIFDLWKWLRLAAVPVSLLLAGGLLLAIHFSGMRPHVTITTASMPRIVDCLSQLPVSVQTSYSRPAYRFHTDGNVVVDSLSYEIVVADGAFHSENRQHFPENPESKIPL